MGQTPPLAPPSSLAIDWDDVARRGQEYYERHLRAQLEPAHHGMFVAIDVRSGDYFLGATDQEALTLATQRRPGEALYLARVGYSVAVRLRRTG
jgi:hypothetical protein